MSTKHLKQYFSTNDNGRILFDTENKLYQKAFLKKAGDRICCGKIRPEHKIKEPGNLPMAVAEFEFELESYF